MAPKFISSHSLQTMPTWSIVLTSAGIAALVSGLISLAGQAIERKARQRELALAKALEMAIIRTELVKEIAEKQGSKATFNDHVILAETYFRWLSHLLDKGELPTDAHPMRTDIEKAVRSSRPAT